MKSAASNRWFELKQINARDQVWSSELSWAALANRDDWATSVLQFQSSAAMGSASTTFNGRPVGSGNVAS